MTNNRELITVYDNRGFRYEVELEHRPQFGISYAYYNGSIIGDVQLGRILPPSSDDDAEWERYDEMYGEWKDDIKSTMQRYCKTYFSNKNDKHVRK